MGRLQTAVGTSTAAGAEEAGRAAATAALAGLAGHDPALVLVYSSTRYDLRELLAGVRAVTGEAPVAGSSTAGHFTGRGSAGRRGGEPGGEPGGASGGESGGESGGASGGESGAVEAQVMGPGEGVMVLALGGGDYRFGVGSARGMAADPEKAGAEAARAARAVARAGRDPLPHAAILLITDSLAGDQQAVLTGVHRVAGAAVPVVGGAAGDDGRMSWVGLLHDGAVLSDSVVAVWIDSPRPLTVGSAHGWTPISLPMMVTSSEGTVVHELGGRRADEVYDELSGRFEAERRTSGNGRSWRPSYALGIIEPDGSHLVRGVYEARTGEVRTFTALPPFTAVQVMTADMPALLSIIDGVVDEVLGDGTPSLLLAFDCIARMAIMGADYGQEAEQLVKAAGDARVFGMYTYGEFARFDGVGGVHNATLTALAL